MVFAQLPNLMNMAFAVSVLATVAMTAVAIPVAKRRPIGTPLTWGEAMIAAAWVFAIMFLAYGVVPHQWLTWADNELGWRKDKILLGPGEIFDKVLPFTLTYLVIRDLIATGIYVVFLGINIWVWSLWQKRGTTKSAPAIETSSYGRPLVKKS